MSGRPLLLAGPTASGKSEVALIVAAELEGEIVSVDSMQVYRGLDIGTAKPSSAERSRVPHHLIDVVGLSESFDAARFAKLAHETVAQIQGRGCVPVLCGGTGLYFKAFLHGLGKAPGADPRLRMDVAVGTDKGSDPVARIVQIRISMAFDRAGHIFGSYLAADVRGDFVLQPVLEDHEDGFPRIDHVRDFASHSQAWIADVEDSHVRIEEPLIIPVVNEGCFQFRFPLQDPRLSLVV